MANINQILVTVVTSTYRKFNFIENAIKSIAEQNYPKIEYIITDDGSENFPEQIISDYIKSVNKGNICSVKIIHHEINVGTVKNLNYAYSQAKGEYIINLSSDDEFFDDNVITKIVNEFEKLNADVLCTSRMMMSATTGKYIRYMPPRLLRHYICKKNTSIKQYNSFVLGPTYEMASGSATSFKTEFWKKWGNFDSSFRLWEDGPFYCEFTKKGGVIKFAYNIISIKYRTGGISMGGMKSEQLMKEDSLYRKKFVVDFQNLSIMQKRLATFNSIINNHHKDKVFFYLIYIDVIVVKVVRKLRYDLSLIIDCILVNFHIM